MCPIADMNELKDRPQKGNLDTWEPEDFLIRKNRATPTEVCLQKELTHEKGKTIREIESSSAKISTLLANNETIIAKAEEDSRRPWYFARV